jgi:PPOX class probable F420-dependent enzyme
MTLTESHRDLLQSPVATLATIGSDGRPQQTVVWFLSDGDSVSLSLNTTRQKVKNLRERPQCSLLILDPANSQRYLEIRGDAELTPDDDYSFATKVGQKYGADLRSFDGPNAQRVVVHIVPSKVNAVDLSAG